MTMANLKFLKVDSIPVTPEPSSVYFMRNGAKLSIHVTDVDGAIIYETYNSVDIASICNLLITSAKGQAGGLADLDLDGLLDPAYIPAIDFDTGITNKPTTVSGYGITDAAAQGDIDTIQQFIDDEVNGNGFVDKNQTTFSFDDSTRTFTLTPLVTPYRVYIKGQGFSFSTVQTVTLENLDGNWYIYFDINGVLKGTQAAWSLDNNALVAIIYWNSTLGASQYEAEERHMCHMDIPTHRYLHTYIGTRYKSGLIAGGYTLIGDGSSDTHAQMSLTSGVIADEDISISITHKATPVAFFEQILNGIAQIPLLYRSIATWVKPAPTNFPVKKGTDRLVFNNYNTGTSQWELKDADEGNYIAAYVVATNHTRNPVVSVLGQRQDTTLDNARINNDFATINWGTMPFPEYKALYKVIYQTSSAYGNSIKGRIVYIEDLRAINTITISSNNIVAHGDTTGLSSDDHVNYVHKTIARLISAIHTFNPDTPNAPFILGDNAQDNVVAGLLAESASRLFTGRAINGVVFDGTADIDIPSVNLILSNTDTTQAAADTIRLIRKEIAHRNLPAYIADKNRASSLQPSFIDNRIGHWATLGNSTSFVYTGSAPPITVLGTATSRSVLTGSYLSMSKRIGFVSGAGAGSLSGYRTSVLHYKIGGPARFGGFFFSHKFAISDASVNAASRMFIGMRNSTSAPVNMSPATMTNIIGIGHEANGVNLRMYCNGTVTQATIDLGSGFPINNLDCYELTLFSPVDESVVYWQVTRLDGNTSVSGVFNGTVGTAIPSENTLLSPLYAFRTNNSTGGAVGIDFLTHYMETDM
jgi:hypothetical protein